MSQMHDLQSQGQQKFQPVTYISFFVIITNLAHHVLIVFFICFFSPYSVCPNIYVPFKPFVLNFYFGIWFSSIYKVRVKLTRMQVLRSEKC